MYPIKTPGINEVHVYIKCLSRKISCVDKGFCRRSHILFLDLSSLSVCVNDTLYRHPSNKVWTKTYIVDSSTTCWTVFAGLSQRIRRHKKDLVT